LTSHLQLVAVLLLAAVNLALLARVRLVLTGTTLIAPWSWCMAAVVAVAGSETLIATGIPGHYAASWIEPLRYVASLGTLCPAMAVLGAKRPQDRGWQWVVLSLWLVLAVPAAHAVATQTGARFELHLAWKMTLGIVLFLEVLNYAMTRHLTGILLFVSVQVILLMPYLSTELHPSTSYIIAAMGLLILAQLETWRQGHRINREPGNLQDIWSRFCNDYGAFWTFRVMGLINQTAIASAWPIALFPDGFYRVHDDAGNPLPEAEIYPLSEIPPELQASVNQALRTTLRRFLSAADLK
jgi:hypothetical protein